MPVLVDSSLWAHQLRRSGDPAKLELWRGVSSDAERRTLRLDEARIQDFAITPAVWNEAIDLAGRRRRSGVTVPVAIDA